MRTSAGLDGNACLEGLLVDCRCACALHAHNPMEIRLLGQASSIRPLHPFSYLTFTLDASRQRSTPSCIYIYASLRKLLIVSVQSKSKRDATGFDNKGRDSFRRSTFEHVLVIMEVCSSVCLWGQCRFDLAPTPLRSLYRADFSCVNFSVRFIKTQLFYTTPFFLL